MPLPPDNLVARSRSPRNSGGRKLLLLGINLALCVFFVRWLNQNIRLDLLIGYFRTIPPWAVVVSILINFAALVGYGMRMALLLRKDFLTSFSIINIGYALNTLTPLRLGEAVKIYLASRLYSISATQLLAGTLVEKLIDLFKLLLLGLLVVAYATETLVDLPTLIAPAIVIAVALTGVIGFRWLIARIDRFLPEGNNIRRVLVDIHRHSGEYPWARIFAVSVAIWTLNVLLVYFVFNAYLGPLDFHLLDAIALLLVLAFAIAIPSAPAGLGLFEAGVVAYLTRFFHVTNEGALAAAVVFHLAISIPQLCFLGGVMLRHQWKAKHALAQQADNIGR